jgi:hypothetical protein
MDHALTALRREMMKVGRLVTAEAFDRFGELPAEPSS